jgi:hypothetical protein
MKQQIEPGFVSLFDGSSIDGWRMCGPGGFTLDRDEGVICSYGGMGLFWYERRIFADFVLRLEWRTRRRTDNSGVFIRFSNPGDDPWSAVQDGYEIQIYDEEWPDLRQVTGAVYGLAPPTHIASSPPGVWNFFEIAAKGSNIKVTLNGHVVVPDFAGERRGEGFIGLQNHDDESQVAFRNVRIREL